MDKDAVRVVFMKFEEDDIIAIFPDIPFSRNPSYVSRMSYMHVGQHSECDLGIVHELQEATEKEYKDLYNELVNMVGYTLKVVSAKDIRKEV